MIDNNSLAIAIKVLTEEMAAQAAELRKQREEKEGATE